MFKDRFDAGRQLAARLKSYAHDPSAIILAVPRGGIEIGYILAKELALPLDILLTKKIGAPGNPEYAIGAVSLESAIIDPYIDTDNPELMNYISQEITRIRDNLRERYKLYRGDKNPPDLAHKKVIITDDGIATGKTLEVSLDLIRKQKPAEIIVAVPVAPAGSARVLQARADDVITVLTPAVFYGVGQFYQNFDQVEDEEAIKLLKEISP